MLCKSPVIAAAALTLMIGMAVTARPARAASEDECAIWLCLPGGFPQGCAAAHAAMMARLRKMKPPLPAFASCAVSTVDSVNLTFDYGQAALIGARQVCRRWEENERSSRCTEWGTVDRHYKKGTSCTLGPDGEGTPPGCIDTYRYIDIFRDGRVLAPTFYW